MIFATGGSTTAFDVVVGVVGVVGVELAGDGDVIAVAETTLGWGAAVGWAETVADAGAATPADEAGAYEAWELLSTAAFPPDVHAVRSTINETTAAIGA